MSGKKRQSANSNMRWHTRVVSSLTSDTEPCISVHFDTAQYLFNCGEGTTRAFIQQKYGIKKSKAIFLTQVKASRSGGLTGMLMSLADSGVSHMNVLGPRGLNHYLASTRPYVSRDWMSVKTSEVQETKAFEQIYEDEHIQVYSLPMSTDTVPESAPAEETRVPMKRRSSDRSLRQDSPKRVARDGSSPNAEDHSPTINMPPGWQRSHSNPTSLEGDEADEWKSRIVRDMFPGLTAQAPVEVDKEPVPGKGKAWTPRARRSPHHLPKFEGSRSTSVVYLVVGPEIRGKFDPAAADALGVAKRDRGKLTKGESVTVTVDGIQTTVTPDMCMGDSEKATALLIVDCPTTDYIPLLPNSTSLQTIQSAKSFTLASIIHRVGPGVLDDQRYTLWAKGISSSECNHLVSGEDFSPNPVSFQSSAHLSLMLSELDKDLFRVPKEHEAKLNLTQAVTDLPENFNILVPAHVTEMTPPKPPIIKHLPSLNADLFTNALKIRSSGGSLLSTPEQKASFEQAKKDMLELGSSRVVEPGPGDDFRITTLGTGSALPSKYRNVISTVIQMPGIGSIMLDCGENTWGQLCRRFGTDEKAVESATSVLTDLQCIFISHVHGDHHMGLLKLLTKRRALLPAPKYPLYLVVNRVTELCIREYHDLENLGLEDELGVKIVQIKEPDNRTKGRFSRDDQTHVPIKLEELKGVLGFDSMEAATVRHRSPSCFGLVARHSSGWSFAYSGDTMPCDALVDAGKDVTLLIHEASMADEEIEKAQEKGHSTIGQAIDVGKRMNAKYLLLTHFSQRYPKMPVLTSGLTATALAFDYMTITMPDIWKMGCYVNALEHVFNSVAQKDDDETMD
ncbi:hypothetical protein BDV93DRAFT_45569 [Ceratobasidium sp. AG-I]|nr:hypothetical protein BDV93DRAFT_45569 [Ceratobasidium sp. AG-I]